MTRPENKVYDQRLLLHASGAETATGNGTIDDGQLPGRIDALAAVLDITADEQAADDTFDCFVQTKLDGTNWLDVIHFEQHLGNAGAARYVAKIVAPGAVGAFDVSDTLASGSVRHLLGTVWRCRWVIVNGTAAEFTFTVTIIPQ